MQRFSLLLCVAVCIDASSVQAQQPPAPTRDVNAVSVIRHSLALMGGEDLIVALKDSKAEGTCTRVTKRESTDHPFRWIIRGDSFRYDHGENDQRGMVAGPHGNGRVMDDKVVHASDRTIHAMKPTHFPALMLARSVREETNSIEYVGTESINNLPAVHVRVTDTKATANALEPQQEDWYFDQASGLPLKVAYSSPAFNSLELYVNSAVEWSQFQQMSGFLIPTTTKQLTEGGPTVACTISTFSVNNSPDDSVFSMTPWGRK